MSTIAFPTATYVARQSDSGRAPAPRLRLTRRGRGVLLTLAATPLVVAALLFALNGGGAVASLESTPVSFDYVTVASGQSLWDVAEAVAPGTDPRDVIDSIVRLNQLESADVFAGQQLAIPLEFAR
ncbi:LysM repeat protein [Leifsonia sp. AK011]|uniref:LysM peptidoglycan-binding domain-containing protein n=1 Tax=Leifsonia sp. AK011 TaxID=2723075 RepID=UPI0015C80593|nr:LysM peptidoglycan-binding domain-containing protein [Leifsonia sp. AK011]NYF10504.1 LysM repeat protein [Leifsonia sp. AK011]